MLLESTEFYNNQSIPVRFTCNGADINPPLTITEPPSGAESLVLIMEDPDAPGGNFVHWIVWDIDPLTVEVQEDSVPEGGTEGLTSFETTGYRGPCPSSGKHRYFFKLFAIDTILGLSNESAKDEVLSAMEGHILAEADLLVGTYSAENSK